MNLFRYQIAGANYILQHKYVINASEMGTGKTLMALDAFDRSGCQKCLIICPAFLKAVWYREIQLHKEHLLQNAIVCHNKKLIPKKMTKICVINYEQIDTAKHLFCDTDFLIIDEAHAFKNWKAKRTKLLHSLVKKYPPEYLNLISGTPIKNRVPELHSLLLLCSYGKERCNGRSIADTMRSKTRFCDVFCYERMKFFGGMRITEYYGLRNAGLLKRYLLQKYFRVRTDKVLDLPDTLHQNLPIAKIKHEKELRNAYELFEKNKQMKTVTPLKLASAIDKIQYTAAFLKELIEQDQLPVVVFSDHIEPVIKLQAFFPKISAVITGKTNVPTRNSIVDQFQAGKIDVLFATIGSASVGLTLTRASKMIFNDLPWVPGDLDQARKRIHRIGQNKKCHYFYIVAAGVDENIVNTLREKAEIISRVL